MHAARSASRSPRSGPGAPVLPPRQQACRWQTPHTRDTSGATTCVFLPVPLSLGRQAQQRQTWQACAVRTALDPGSERTHGWQLALEVTRMESQVIFDESGDEKIAVVVAVLHAQVERDTAPLAYLLEEVGFELCIQER